VRTTLGAEIPIRRVFQSPTVAALARRLAGDTAVAGRVRPALRRAVRPDVLPLSHAQRRLWFIHRFEGPSATYNIPLAVRLRGELDTEALTAAVRDVVVRHESLRTLFREDADGVPYQHIVPAGRLRLDVPLTDPATAGELARHGFDLAREIPLRAAVARVGPREHVLLVVLHHIAGDGASMAPLARDISTAYTARHHGTAPDWPELPVQYADYTLWQRELLGDDTDPDSPAARQSAYWREQLAAVPQLLPLPTDRPRPANASYRGDIVDFRLDADLTEAVGRLAHERGLTTAMVLHTALAVLLHRLGGGTDLTIGSPIAGRTDDALSELIGFFVNTWVLRADLSGDPAFDRLLDQVRDRSLAAYDRQDLPFERLVELLEPARSTAYQPLFQTMFAWQNGGWPDLSLPGVETTVEPVRTGTAKFDLFFNLVPVTPREGERSTVLGGIEYATDLFDRATVERLATRYTRLIRQLVSTPGARLSATEVLLPGEREQLEQLNGTGRELTDATVADLFEQQAARTPDAPALISGEQRLTYGRLNTRANRLAHWLIQRGAGPEQRVALLLPRTADLVVALLAVLKTGAAYVPVDPDHPAPRIDHILTDSQPVLILDAEAVAEGLRHTDGANPVRSGTDADSAAYAIYTSGSTGLPKGVVVGQRALVNFLTAMQDRF
ncbi:condensation domain-containing protein, partial [Streptomyces sp. LP05-1]